MGPPPVPFSPPSAVASLHGHGDATNGIAIASGTYYLSDSSSRLLLGTSELIPIITGPLRHPRPLTAAELHLELEKEQEGMVSFRVQDYRTVDVNVH